MIAKIETAVLRGGLFAMAMPRGSGKTTLAETACIWAMLTGAQQFVCLIGSDAGHARSMLESIKVEFETNERLLDDFPEAVFPIHALERIHNRAKGQLCGDKPTRIVWTADEIVLPTIPGSKASGTIIRVAGIESRIRGMKFKRADGRAVRPSLVVLDDPQTYESARSDMQVRARMETLNGAILNLAGPGQKISGIMPCTVIRPGDMADQILDRDKHPAWQGERTGEQGQTTGTNTTGRTDAVTPPTQPVVATYRRFHGSVQLDSLRVGRDASRIADEVIQHLSKHVGANVEVTLEIRAEIPDGATEKTIRDVTENCRTLRFDTFGFEEQ